MGTRIVYRVVDNNCNVVATLFSNSSHETQFAEDVFQQLVNDANCASGANALVEAMMTARYQTSDGNHRVGERIFWLVPAEEATHGEREAVITAIACAPGEELAAKGYVATPSKAWGVQRQDV